MKRRTTCSIEMKRCWLLSLGKRIKRSTWGGSGTSPFSTSFSLGR